MATSLLVFSDREPQEWLPHTVDRMTHSVIPMSVRDATLIHERLEPLLRPVAEVLDGYVRAARLRNGEE